MRKLNFQRTGVFLCSEEIKEKKQVYQTDWLSIHGRHITESTLQAMKSLVLSSSHDRNTLMRFRGDVVFRVTGNSLVAWMQHQQGVSLVKAKMKSSRLNYLSVGHRCRVGSSWPSSLALTERQSRRPRLKSWRSTACTRGSRIYRAEGQEKREREREKRGGFNRAQDD